MPEVTFYVLGDLPCSIWKHDSLGHLCGYVGVPKSHPWYGLGYDDIDAEIHGGLTFSQHETDREEPYPHDTGQDIWWVGFDCAHAGDMIPRYVSEFPGETCRDENYVRQEIESLVHQAAIVVNRNPVQ